MRTIVTALLILGPLTAAARVEPSDVRALVASMPPEPAQLSKAAAPLRTELAG